MAVDNFFLFFTFNRTSQRSSKAKQGKLAIESHKPKQQQAASKQATEQQVAASKSISNRSLI